jgi:hypothetical protein
VSLIDRLQAANKGLIGAKEHHDSIAEVIDILIRHGPALRVAARILETARPLVLALEVTKDADKEINR